jgi:hypothetical protein
MRELFPPAPPIRTRETSAACLVIAARSGRRAPRYWRRSARCAPAPGLVTIATPRSCVATLAAMMPEYMTEGLEETAGGAIDFSAVIGCSI